MHSWKKGPSTPGREWTGDPCLGKKRKGDGGDFQFVGEGKRGSGLGGIKDSASIKGRDDPGKASPEDK